MRILVTGSSGTVGAAVMKALAAHGDDVDPFDLTDGLDVEDADAVIAAARTCDVIVHLAAVDDPVDDIDAELASTSTVGTPERVVTTTVVGTMNVLEGARRAGHHRVVFMSSVDALGIFMGHRTPDYLPIDDHHPTYPATPYGLAKRAAERMCAAFTIATGIATICLRPPGVWTLETFAMIRDRWARDPLNDRRPFWEYGAFIANEDLAELVVRAVHHPFDGHAVFHCGSDDAALAVQTSREAARSICPDVPWKGGKVYDHQPFRTLLDNSRVKLALGWEPKQRFRSC